MTTTSHTPLERSVNSRREQINNILGHSRHNFLAGLDEYVADTKPNEMRGKELCDESLAAHKMALLAIGTHRLMHLDFELSQARLLCESPIEEIFLYAFLLHLGITGSSVEVLSSNGHVEYASGVGLSCEKWCIKPQHVMGKYRVDFLVSHEKIGASVKSDSATNLREVKIASVVVECDGHDYHEKTKAQAQRDKSRDRSLQSLGIHVFHFTGAEIFRDPLRCVEETAKHLESYMRDTNSTGHHP